MLAFAFANKSETTRRAAAKTIYGHLDVGGHSLIPLASYQSNLGLISEHTLEASFCVDVAADLAVDALYKVLGSLGRDVRAINLRISTGRLPRKQSEAKVYVDGVDAALGSLDARGFHGITLRVVFVQGTPHTIASRKRRVTEGMAFSVLMRRILTFRFVKRLEIATHSLFHTLGWATAGSFDPPLQSRDKLTIEEVECRVDTARFILRAGLPLKRFSFHATSDFTSTKHGALSTVYPANEPQFSSVTTVDIFISPPPASYYQANLTAYEQMFVRMVPSRLHRLNFFAEEDAWTIKEDDEPGWLGASAGIIGRQGYLETGFHNALAHLARRRPNLQLDEVCFWNLALTSETVEATPGARFNYVDEEGQALVEQQLRQILPPNPAMRVLFDHRPRLSLRVVELYQ